MMLKRFLYPLIGLLLSAVSLSWADTLIVYPLESQDTLLGVGIAERVAQAFSGELDVIGPEVAPALAPPVTTRDGFINLSEFLGRSVQAPVLSTRPGLRVLQETLGADNLVTGELELVGDELRGRFFWTTAENVRSFQVAASAETPGDLVDRAAAVLAAWLNVELPDLETDLDLSSPYGEYVRALGLVGAGLSSEALSVLNDLSEADAAAEPRVGALREALETARTGAATADPALAAALSLGLEPLDEDLSTDLFAALYDATELPAAKTWIATLYASDNRESLAEAAFDEAAAAYPFGAAARAAYSATRGAGAEALSELSASASPADLLTASLLANVLGDVALEKTALQNLSRALPTHLYAFERLSFIAFDEEEPLAAAQALAVAVERNPDSDLYWTNLGWSYYLLGLLEQSERASERAAQLSGDQFIALYNLGLARVVTGRLDEAMTAYEAALAINPEVDDAAVQDLLDAFELYPNEPAVHYALGALYERAGRRNDAAQEFETYLAAVPEGDFATQARESVAALRAPLPPIDISAGASLGLGPSAVEAAPYHPGDRIYASFELSTSGDELPTSADALVSLRQGDEVLSEETLELTIPPNAVGYAVRGVALDLPVDLEPGSYTLNVRVVASEERSAALDFDLAVSGEPELLRRLLSRNITMQTLSSGSELYTSQDLGAGEADQELIRSLLEELRGNASAAEEALPEVSTGRFEGAGGGELFSNSSDQDVRDFLSFLLSQNTVDATFNFADAYAQWALDGAPSADN